jgi:hypothetical protein
MIAMYCRCLCYRAAPAVCISSREKAALQIVKESSPEVSRQPAGRPWIAAALQQTALPGVVQLLRHTIDAKSCTGLENLG